MLQLPASGPACCSWFACCAQWRFAEVLFLKFVASPDSVNLMVAAEGVVIPQ